jgi:predicted phage terminase large subunit-like protein
MLSFDAWLPVVTSWWTWDWSYLRLIQAQLDQVTAGRVRKLMLFLPPRHGKSELTTVRYPVWRLERDPAMRVIVGAYNQTLADKFSRKSRRIALQRFSLSQERTAVEDWETTRGGGLRAVGVGGGITGQGGDLIIIDDPVKSREEANSPAYRERVWDWYTQDLYTRLEPGGSMILIMCMTGDTPVLMADGTERPLRDVKVGDRVATYDNGKLATSTVRNHNSNGLDSVFRIKTICGKIVYANERHPFLVEEHGQLKWIRLKYLTTDHRIVTLGDRRANGKERHAPLTAATSPLARGAIAPHITARRCGPMGIAHRQSMQSTDATYVSSSAMESPLLSMTLCTKRKAASALSADSRQETTYARIGAASFALTTATKRTPFEGFCATTVISLWDTPRQRQPRSPLLNTSDFTTAQIESIEPAGVEEVFDIQIARTENFIANGLVSHNTRWHEDDLAGRILASEDGPNWEILSLPALAEPGDPLGRALGEALCPNRFTAEDLAKIRTVLGTWAFTALYQQRPLPAEGGMFKLAWFEIIPAAPVSAVARVRFWDKAGSAGRNDYTAGVRIAKTKEGIYIIEDVVRGQWSALEREKIIRQTAELDGPSVPVWIEQEQGSGGKESAENSIRTTLAGYIVHAERPSTDKVIRAEAFSAQCEAGNVKLVRADWNAAYLAEIASFPEGAHDDQVDASSGAFNKLAIPTSRVAAAKPTVTTTADLGL